MGLPSEFSKCNLDQVWTFSRLLLFLRKGRTGLISNGPLWKPYFQRWSKQWLYIHLLSYLSKPKCSRGATFVVPDGTGRCFSDNLQCRLWRQSWYYSETTWAVGIVQLTHHEVQGGGKNPVTGGRGIFTPTADRAWQILKTAKEYITLGDRQRPLN